MAYAKAKKDLDLSRPVTVWRSKDLLEGRPAESLTMILRTVGCRWNRCTMCGYASEGAPATAEDLLTQFDNARQRLSPDVKIMKIYTSGSFLDPREVPYPARDRILDLLKSAGIERLVIESRPEHINSERVEACLSRVETEFAIGLETSNDLIRQEIICKGFTFQDFRSADVQAKYYLADCSLSRPSHCTRQLRLNQVHGGCWVLAAEESRRSDSRSGGLYPRTR